MAKLMLQKWRALKCRTEALTRKQAAGLVGQLKQNQMCSCNNDNNRESILEKIFMILASLYLCAQLYKMARNWYVSLTKKEKKILWITVVLIVIIAQFFE